MPAHNRSKSGVASLAYVASIHVSKDGRNGGQAATMLNADCSLPPTSNVVRSGTDGCEVAVVSDGPVMLPARSRFLPGMAVDSPLAVARATRPQRGRRSQNIVNKRLRFPARDPWFGDFRQHGQSCATSTNFNGCSMIGLLSGAASERSSGRLICGARGCVRSCVRAMGTRLRSTEREVSGSLR